MSDGSGDPFTRGERAAPEGDKERPGPSRGRLLLSGGRARIAGLQGRPHSPQQSWRLSWMLAALLGLAYWFTQWLLPDLLSSHPDFNYYLVQPVIWTGLALLAGYGWLRLEDPPRFSRLLVGIALLIGIFHVAVTVIAGIIWSFGDSPIAGRLVNYPKNLLFIATLLAGAEVSRAFLFHVWRRRSERLAFAGVSLLLFAVAVAAAQWTPFDTVDLGLRVVGGRWLPALALSLLCTWLASYGGIGPSFAYRFALVAFEGFSPILPNLDWLVLLVIGVVTPQVSVWLVRSIYEDTREGRERHPAPSAEEEQKEAPARPPRPRWVRWTGWVVTAAVIALMVLFAVGAFGSHLSVVDGRSMEPALSRGDLLIVREGVDPESLQVGDLVEFRLGNLPVAHRIIAIDEGSDRLLITTQGDAMDQPDPPLSADQIGGKVVFSIPGVGYLNLWLRGR